MCKLICWSNHPGLCPLYEYLVYFYWWMCIPLLSCLIWNPRKNLSSLIILISNSLFIISEKSLHIDSLVAPKIISSTYIWTIMKSFQLLFWKELCLLCLSLNHFSKRKELGVSYQLCGACFKPYKAFLRLKTWSGRVWSSKPWGYLTYTSSSINSFRKRTFNIYLKRLYVFISNKCKHDSYSFEYSNRNKGFSEIYTFLMLIIALSY